MVLDERYNTMRDDPCVKQHKSYTGILTLIKKVTYVEVLVDGPPPPWVKDRRNPAPILPQTSCVS